MLALFLDGSQDPSVPQSVATAARSIGSSGAVALRMHMQLVLVADTQALQAVVSFVEQLQASGWVCASLDDQ